MPAAAEADSTAEGAADFTPVFMRPLWAVFMAVDFMRRAAAFTAAAFAVSRARP
jgi:hypothetical protein